MHWLTLLIITAIFFGLYNFFIKLSSGHIHEILGAVILQVVAVVLGGLALLFLKLMKTTMLEISCKGIWFAVWAGIFVGLAEITSFYAFSKGIAASVAIPVIVGGTLLVGALLGIFILKETLAWPQYLGIFFILAGVILLASKQ